MLKKKAGLVGASLIQYDCYFVQKHYLEKNMVEMNSVYNRLVEDCIHFIFEAKSVLERLY